MPISPEVIERLRYSHLMPKLSDEMLQLIGLIITQWAAVEDELKKCLATAAEIRNHGIGRLILREPRAHDFPRLIADVLQARGIDVDWERLRDLASRLETTLEDRNKLAHGAWTTMPEKTGGFSVRLLVTAGRWPPRSQQKIGMKGAIPKRVVRHMTRFDQADAEKTLTAIIELGDEVTRLHLDLIGLLPLPPKSREPGS